MTALLGYWLWGTSDDIDGTDHFKGPQWFEK